MVTLPAERILYAGTSGKDIIMRIAVTYEDGSCHG